MTNGKIQTLPIVMIGHEILRGISEQVERLDQVAPHVDIMLATMSRAFGVGLAAPQVNIGLRFFVCNLAGAQRVIVNPVVRKSRMQQNSAEGCLSIPGIGHVESIRRYGRLDVEFLDAQMERQRMSLSGQDAIVFQHELDHLNGVLYIDHMTPEGRDKATALLHDLSQAPRRRLFYDMLMPDGTVFQANSM